MSAGTGGVLGLTSDPNSACEAFHQWEEGSKEGALGNGRGEAPRSEQPEKREEREHGVAHPLGDGTAHRRRGRHRLARLPGRSRHWPRRPRRLGSGTARAVQQVSAAASGTNTADGAEIPQLSMKGVLTF